MALGLQLRKGMICNSSDIETESSSLRLNEETIGDATVGACAGVLVLSGAFLWWRRRHRRPGTFPTGDPKPSTDYGTGSVTPHTPPLPSPLTGTIHQLLLPPSTSTSIPSPPVKLLNIGLGPGGQAYLHNPTSSSSSAHTPGSVQETSTDQTVSSSWLCTRF